MDGDLWRAEQGAWEMARAADALPSGPVTALLEDSRGVIWCGGERGVAEYDGSSWRAARFGADVPVAAATALAEDGEGRVWVGTRAGAGFSDGYEWTWFDARSGLPADEVLALAADRNGSIWVGTPRGIARFDTSWSQPAAARREGVGPRAPLLGGRDGALYLGAGRGFVVQRGVAFETVGPREGLDARVRVFAEDAEGNLWVGTDQGLVRYDGSVREQHLPEVQTVYVQREWGATEAQKVVVCDRYRGLTGAEVTALAVDAEGGLWVGTARRPQPPARRGVELPAEPGEAARGACRVGAAGRPARRALGRHRRRALGARGGGVAPPRAGHRARRGRGDRPARRRRRPALGRDEPRGSAAGRARPGSRWTRGRASISDRVLALFAERGGRLWVGTEEGVSCLDGGLWGVVRRAGRPAVAARRLDRGGRRPRLVRRRRGRRRPPPRPRAAADPDQEPARGAGRRAVLPLRVRRRRPGDPAARACATPGASTAARGRAGPAETLGTVTELTNGRHEFEVRSLDGELNADPTPAAVAFEVNTALFDLELVEAAFGPLYASLTSSTRATPGSRRPPPAA